MGGHKSGRRARQRHSREVPEVAPPQHPAPEPSLPEQPLPAVPEAVRRVAPVWWCAVALALAGALTYQNALSNPFVLDDNGTVVTNERIRDLTSLAALWPEREETLAGRPVASLTFAINYAIGGLDVRGYRATNIVIHVFCGLLLFGIIRRTLQLQSIGSLSSRAIEVAFAASLLWLLHPLNSEVMNYLTQRTESLMALFYLLTLYASLRAAEGKPAIWPAVAVLACALGMGSKESMASAPLVVVLFDRVFLFDSFSAAFARRWRLYAGLAATWIILGAILWTEPRPRSAGFFTGVSPWTYFLNQPSLIARYLWLTVWPSSLVANYGWPVEVSFRAALPYLVLIGSFFAATLAALRRSPQLGFLGAWFFITLAPASSFVPVATEVGAERRMYLPLAALMVLAVVGVTLAWDRLTRERPHLAWRTRTAGLALVLLLIGVSSALALTTVSRNREYGSRIGLARITLERYPTSSIHHVLAEYLLAEGQRDEAIRHLRQALPGAPRAHYTLGIELYKQGRLDEAIVEFRAFVEKQPFLAQVIEAHGYLGKAYAAQENWSGAIDAFRAILRLTPDNPVADHSLADVLFAAGRVAESIPHYQTYLAEYATDVDALNQLGMALASTGKLDEAAATFLRAERIDPNNASVQHNLATVFWNLNDREAALEHARRALALRPDDVEARQLVETLTRR